MTQLNLDFSYQAAINFTNRDEYLVFRRMWKEDYKKLSADIREKKIAFKEAQRLFSKQPYTSANRNQYWAAFNAVSDLRNDLQKMAKKATSMIAERHAAKEKSHEQYLAEKASA